MNWFVEMCEGMKLRHGEHGWKRRLAEMLGVSDSNVQNWIRAGTAPPIVKTAYEATQRVQELEDDLGERECNNFGIEELGDGRGYQVLVLDPKSGRFVNIATTTKLSIAHAIVQFESGSLEQKISTVVQSAEILFENHPEDLQSLNDLVHWNQPTRRERAAETVSTLHDIMEGHGHE